MEQQALETLATAIRARTPVIAIESTEEERITSAITRMARQPTINSEGLEVVGARTVLTWSHTRGITGPQAPEDWAQLTDPAAALAEYSAWASASGVDPEPNEAPADFAARRNGVEAAR